MQIITNEEIDAAVAAFDDNTAMAAAPAAAFNFCTAWPVAKQVLEFLSSIPAYGWVVKLVIALGDAYFSRKCPS